MKLNIVTKEPVLKGWSSEKKWRITDETGNQFLMRISDIEDQQSKLLEFKMMQQVAALGVPMCLPIEFGVDDTEVYSIQSWIEGKDADQAIPSLPTEQQYAYGLEAGRLLKKIHSIPAPDNIEDWATMFNRKITSKLQRYSECPIKYPNGQAFIDYVTTHRHLLNGRPQTYQHGDYHIGNMMLDLSGKLHIIDFNRSDFGDPWEEFNRMVWSAQKAPAFASGMIDGYFDGEVPDEFWGVMALYISSNMLSSIYWAIPFGEEEINIMLNQAEEVLSWYANMTDIIPTWYKQYNYWEN